MHKRRKGILAKMKFEFNKRYTTIALYAFLALSGVVLFWVCLSNFNGFGVAIKKIFTLLTPFIYGFALAYLLNPVLKVIERRCLTPIFRGKLSGKALRGWSILLTFLVATGAIAVFVRIVLPQLAASISGLVSKLLRFLNAADRDLLFQQITYMMPDIDISATVWDYIERYAAQIIETVYNLLTAQILPIMTNITTGLASGLLNVVVGIIISVYVLADKERFGAGVKQIFYAILPSSKSDWVLELAGDANRIFGGFINGKMLDSLIIGIICFFGMSLLNNVLPFSMSNPMLISVIVGVTNVIPYFGPFIGAIPSFFIILIESPKGALVFLLFVLALQQFDGNILGPKILGESTGLSAFWVIFSITLFGGLFGFLGMFLGVPIFSVIFMLVNRFVRSRLVSRGMPLEMAEYCAPDAPLLKADSSAKKAGKKSKAHTVKPLSAEDSQKQALDEKDKLES